MTAPGPISAVTQAELQLLDEVETMRRIAHRFHLPPLASPTLQNLRATVLATPLLMDWVHDATDADLASRREAVLQASAARAMSREVHPEGGVSHTVGSERGAGAQEASKITPSSAGTDGPRLGRPSFLERFRRSFEVSEDMAKVGNGRSGEAKLVSFSAMQVVYEETIAMLRSDLARPDAALGVIEVQAAISILTGPVTIMATVEKLIKYQTHFQISGSVTFRTDTSLVSPLSMIAWPGLRFFQDDKLREYLSIGRREDVSMGHGSFHVDFWPPLPEHIQGFLVGTSKSVLDPVRVLDPLGAGGELRIREFGSYEPSGVVVSLDH